MASSWRTLLGLTFAKYSVKTAAVSLSSVRCATAIGSLGSGVPWVRVRDARVVSGLELTNKKEYNIKCSLSLAQNVLLLKLLYYKVVLA